MKKWNIHFKMPYLNLIRYIILFDTSNYSVVLGLRNKRENICSRMTCLFYFFHFRFEAAEEQERLNTKSD